MSVQSHNKRIAYFVNNINFMNNKKWSMTYFIQHWTENRNCKHDWCIISIIRTHCFFFLHILQIILKQTLPKSCITKTKSVCSLGWIRTFTLPTGHFYNRTSEITTTCIINVKRNVKGKLSGKIRVQIVCCFARFSVNYLCASNPITVHPDTEEILNYRQNTHSSDTTWSGLP